MTLHHRFASLIFVVALATVGLLGGGTATSAAAPPPDVSRKASPPATSRYVGTFRAQLDWQHDLDFGNNNHSSSSAKVSISGKLPAVRFAGGRLLGTTGGTAPSATGTTSSDEWTNDGATSTKCTGHEVHASAVPALLQPVAGTSTFYAFNSLILPTICESTETLFNDYQEQVDLPALPIPVQIRASSIGAKVIRIPFDRTAPLERCPGYVAPGHVRCVYRLAGQLTLRLVPDIDIFRAPTKVKLARDASQASVRVGCTQACRASVTIRPLQRTGAMTTTATLRPRSSKNVTTQLPAPLRRAVQADGGARISVKYRSAKQTQVFDLQVVLR